MEKVDSMKEQVDNVSTEMTRPGKNQMKMLQIKNKVTKVKNVFDGLITRLDRTDISILSESSTGQC